MKLRSNNISARASGLFLGLGLVFGVSLVSLGFSSDVRGGSRGDVDRGENPVVGSLPCKVDPNLDTIFWEGMGHDDPGFAPAFYPVTIGLCSDDIRGDIHAADGDPYGVLNDRYDWRAFGLQKHGWASVRSNKFTSGAISSWMWAPSGYLGGEWRMQSSLLGTHKTAVGQNAIELPMVPLIQATGNNVSITKFELRPPVGSSLPVVKFRVTVKGGILDLEFL
jgi:hypothetical protein